jgi:thiol:disulfide interchange protein DsbD
MDGSLMKNFQFLLLFLLSTLLSTSLHANSEDDFIPAEKAFIVSHEFQNDSLILHWKLADKIHVYKDAITLKLLKGEGVTLGQMKMPKAHVDDMGDAIFGGTFDITVAIANTNSSDFSLSLEYRGCSDLGLCYPPQTKQIDFTAPPAKTATSSDTKVSEQDSIANILKSGSLWITLITFFGFGLLLSMTPCIFPMIPILSSVIIAQGEHISTKKAFGLSLVYVLAMAVAYTVAGVMAGLFGSNIQAALQNPYVISGFAFTFVILSLSMFGFYDLEMPKSLQSKLTKSTEKGAGTVTGVAIMGFFSALIVGPCVAAPLAGALVYIGETGDALLGGLALFSLSIGMGVPLLIIGTGAGKFMPKPGMWMDSVKSIFGVIMIGVAIWMLDRIVDESTTMLLMALLLGFSAIYLGALEPIKEEFENGWKKFIKAIGVFLLLYSIILFIGAFSKGSLFDPLKGLSSSSGAIVTTQTAEHETIHSIVELEAILAHSDRPVMLDFYADWCVSCKEMEEITFKHVDVQKKMKAFRFIQADVTKNSDDEKALMKRFKLFGPPGIIFFDKSGKELKPLQLVGFKAPKEFLAHLDKI